MARRASLMLGRCLSPIRTRTSSQVKLLTGFVSSTRSMDGYFSPCRYLFAYPRLCTRKPPRHIEMMSLSGAKDSRHKIGRGASLQGAGSQSKRERFENICRNAVLFLGASQRPSTYQLCHALHHKMTTKEPRGKPVFPKTPAKNTGKAGFCLHHGPCLFL